MRAWTEQRMKLTPQPEPVLPPLESATTFSCVLFNPSQPQFQKWTENDGGNGDSISASPFCRATAPWQAFSHVEVIVVVDALEASFFSLWEILRSGRFRFSFSKAARRCHLPSFSSLEFASHFWCDQRRCMA